jgi:predicted nucleic-acid-binding Zn-ribbon protein
MFCPKCLYEYEKGVTKCPDCGSGLVEEDPVKESGGDLPDIRVSELADVENETQAQVLRDMLMQEGIHSFLRTNLLPHSNIALGFFAPRKYGTIIVNREEMKKAREVLKDFKGL